MKSVVSIIVGFDSIPATQDALTTTLFGSQPDKKAQNIAKHLFGFMQENQPATFASVVSLFEGSPSLHPEGQYLHPDGSFDWDAWLEAKHHQAEVRAARFFALPKVNHVWIFQFPGEWTDDLASILHGGVFDKLPHEHLPHWIP